jgi:hypothetical protein
MSESVHPWMWDKLKSVLSDKDAGTKFGGCLQVMQLLYCLISKEQILSHLAVLNTRLCFVVCDAPVLFCFFHLRVFLKRNP